MSLIKDALDELMKAIRESDEYQRYQAARAELCRYPELEQVVHEFRKKNYSIQNSGKVNLYDEVERLERESTDLRRNPVAEEYFAAELLLCRMVQTINWRIFDGLDFEVGFADE